MKEEIKTELKEFLDSGNYSPEEQESLTLFIDGVLLNEPNEDCCINNKESGL